MKLGTVKGFQLKDWVNFVVKNLGMYLRKFFEKSHGE